VELSSTCRSHHHQSPDAAPRVSIAVAALAQNAASNGDESLFADPCIYQRIAVRFCPAQIEPWHLIALEWVSESDNVVLSAHPR